jgi:hypothetical protein
MCSFVTVNDQTYFLLSTSRYSVTTAKHQRELYWASKGFDQVQVPKIGDMDHCLHAWTQQALQLQGQLSRARKPELYRGRLDYLTNEVDRYFDIFGGTPPAELSAALGTAHEAWIASAN